MKRYDSDGQASAENEEEIEVTKEMIEAGADYLRCSFEESFPFSNDYAERAAVQVFQVMARHHPNLVNGRLWIEKIE